MEIQIQEAQKRNKKKKKKERKQDEPKEIDTEILQSKIQRKNFESSKI